MVRPRIHPRPPADPFIKPPLHNPCHRCGKKIQAWRLKINKKNGLEVDYHHELCGESFTLFYDLIIYLPRPLIQRKL